MRKALQLGFMLLLAACAGPKLQAPAPNSLSAPPWDILVQAGPEAYKDIDFETLDGPLKPSSSGIEAAAAQKSKNAAAATAIKAVTVASVKGAKGRGNGELMRAIKSELQKSGWPILDAKQNDTLVILGTVSFSPDPEGERVVIVWTVTTPDGRSLGDVKQENVVAAGSLQQGFGQAAEEIAAGAASGIFELVGKFQQ